MGDPALSWRWRYESADGRVVRGSVPDESFATQSDAESWLGEHWRRLLADGVAQVTLLDGDQVVYGPMGLSPAG